MKKKLLSGLLAITMALTPIGVAGAEFTDGNMTEKANEILAGEETFIDKDTSTEAEPFTDSEVFSEEESVAVEDINVPAAHAQNLYQVSVSGELILSETQKFVKLLNAERAKLGVPPVRLDQRMMEIAKERAIQGSIAYGHNIPSNGMRASQMYGISECAIWGTGNVVTFFNSWKNSPEHWKILSAPQNTRFGIAFLRRTNCYGYTASGRDTSERPYNPYVGDFKDKKINDYQISILNKYLDMTNENITINVGNNVSLKPRYKVYDTVSDNNRGYDLGYGTLSNKDGVWESDNSSVASVDDDGLVKAHKGGTAKIRFYVNGDRDKYYENIVTVTGNDENAQTATSFEDGKFYNGKTPLFGWVNYKGNIYYATSPFGYAAKAYRVIDGKTYFFYNYANDCRDKDGERPNYPECAMVKDVDLCIDGQWYHFDKNGLFKEISKPTKPTPSPSTTKKPGKVSLNSVPYQYSNVKLTWKKVSDAKGYQVYQYNSSTKKYTRIATVGASTLSYTVKAGYGKTLKFKVRAYNKGDAGTAYGSFSAVTTVKTAPAATTITKATAGNGSVSLTWKKSAGAEYYQIYRAISKNGTYSKVKTVKGNVLTYKNTGLKRGKSYYYKIRSYRVQPDGKKVYSKFSPAVGKKTK